MLELYQAIFLFFFFQAVFARRLSIYPSTDSILCTAFPIDLCVRVCERIYFEILCCASYRMVDRFLSKCTHNFIPLPSPPLSLSLSGFHSSTPAYIFSKSFQTFTIIEQMSVYKTLKSTCTIYTGYNIKNLPRVRMQTKP